eukprot:1183488-Prorocentrum_minimum.AAC.3
MRCPRLDVETLPLPPSAPIALQYTALHLLYCAALHYTTLHYITALHCTVLCCTTLHYITVLHYTTLYYECSRADPCADAGRVPNGADPAFQRHPPPAPPDAAAAGNADAAAATSHAVDADRKGQGTGPKQFGPNSWHKCFGPAP